MIDGAVVDSELGPVSGGQGSALRSRRRETSVESVTRRRRRRRRRDTDADLRFGFLRLSTIKKCPHMLRSDHRELR